MNGRDRISVYFARELHVALVEMADGLGVVSSVATQRLVNVEANCRMLLVAESQANGWLD